MSVTIREAKWDKIGSISVSDSIQGIRFRSSSIDRGDFGYYSPSGSKYQSAAFSYDSSNFSNVINHTETISELLSAFPTSAGGSGDSIAYRTSEKILTRYEGTLYTLHTGSTYGLDANVEFYVAYSFIERSASYLRFGKLYELGTGTLALGGLVNAGLAGPVSISRNGLYAAVAGDITGDGRFIKTIKVFTPSGGAYPSGGTFTPTQVGGDITIPGTENIDILKLNDTGSRLVVSTFSGTPTIFTYDLISGAWVLRNSFSLSSNSARGLSISDDGRIMAFRGNDFVNTYSWSSASTSWWLTDTTTILSPLSYYGNTIDISADAKFMVVDMWPTTSTRALEIYRSTIADVTYDAPVITPGQSFTLVENRIFSGRPTVLNDGLPREVIDWSATGLPSGLSINSSTGQITGSPTTRGQFTATITATGPGGSDAETIAFSVIEYFPLYRGSTIATAIYAGATEGKALYYGPQLLWNVPGWEPLPSAASFTGAAAGDEFGYSVAMNSRGNRIVIGARRNDAGGSNAGAVSVFEFSAGTWSQLGTDIIGPASESFGGTVCMNATGDIIAARGSGKVRVYEWTGSSWAQRGSQITQLSGSPSAATAQFGIGLALSAAGDVLAIGAPDGLSYSGYTEVYEWSGTAWSLRGSRILSEVSGDRSGQSVSLSADGTRIAIGARYSDANGTSSGHARVLEWSGSAWEQVGASIPGAAAWDEAGYSVSLNSTGTRIAIGARYHDVPVSNAGHCRVFEEISGAWVQMGQSMNGEAIDNWSGCSVSLNSTGDIVAIGAERNNGDAGHVRIYQWNGTSWQQQGGDIDGDAAGDKLGFSVALNGAGTLLIAGAPYSDALGTSTGSAKVIPLPAAP